MRIRFRRMPQRSLRELLDTHEPAWTLVQGWLAEARHAVAVVPAERTRGEQTLFQLQVTARSPLGAVALETAAIVVDHGWLRVLGAGSEHLRDSLLTFNGLADDTARNLPEPIAGALVIAHDAIGGFFALNGGAFQGERGAVYYFAPDTLEWEPLHLSYTGFLRWVLTDSLNAFYAPLRWPGWEQEVAALGGDQGFSISPFLWLREGGPVGARSRRAVPITELWALHRDLARQINGSSLPGGPMDHRETN